jgi:hypothetical protein
MRGGPLCIYTCLLIRLGLWFCIDKWLLIRLELWRCIYTVTYAFSPVRFEVLRAQGSDASPPRSAIRTLLLFYAVGGITLRVYLVQVGWVMRFFLTGGGGKRGRIGRIPQGLKPLFLAMPGGPRLKPWLTQKPEQQRQGGHERAKETQGSSLGLPAMSYLEAMGTGGV